MLQKSEFAMHSFLYWSFFITRLIAVRYLCLFFYQKYKVTFTLKEHVRGFHLYYTDDKIS